MLLFENGFLLFDNNYTKERRRRRERERDANSPIQELKKIKKSHHLLPKEFGPFSLFRNCFVWEIFKRKKEKGRGQMDQIKAIFYKDESGEIQGPFHPGQMQNWWKLRHLKDDLMIRVGVDDEFESLESRLSKTKDPFGIDALLAKIARIRAETQERNDRMWMSEVRKWVSAKGWKNETDPDVTKSVDVVKEITEYPLERVEKEEKEEDETE